MTSTPGLHVVSVTWRDACAFVAMWHRHHTPPAGCKFCIGAASDTGVLIGVAITGRPVARHLDDGTTLEVTRVATDCTANACSLLYAACWRAAKALGLCLAAHLHPSRRERCQLARGAGWHVIAQRPAHPGWDRPSRPRQATGTEHIPAPCGKPPLTPGTKGPP